jgi:hypothetical protein
MPPDVRRPAPLPARVSHRRERSPISFTGPRRAHEQSISGERLSTKGSTGHGPCGQKGKEATDSDEGLTCRRRRTSNGISPPATASGRSDRDVGRAHGPRGGGAISCARASLRLGSRSLRRLAVMRRPRTVGVKRRRTEVVAGGRARRRRRVPRSPSRGRRGTERLEAHPCPLRARPTMMGGYRTGLESASAICVYPSAR